MTDQLPLLREALIQAETHHAGLSALQQELGSAVGAGPMDATAAVADLVRRLRDRVEEIKESEREDAELNAELRALGIDPDELDDEDPGDDWTAIAAQMLNQPGSMTRLLFPPPGGCYLTASGLAVHVRPGCRC